MSTTEATRSIQELWEEASADVVEINAAGKIIDYINPATLRPDTKEERVRQGYARILVEEYGYPRERIGLERTIHIGSEPRRADIVVYDSLTAQAANDQGRIRLIVETKEPTKEEGRSQLISYVAASTAEGGVWTNQNGIAYYRRLNEPNFHLQEWTNIPRFGETWDAVGKYRKSDLKPPRNLKQVFRRCHNAIYRQGLDSEDVALDMVRIILAKYRDEQNDGEFCDFRCTPEEFASSEGRRNASDRVRNLFLQVRADHPGVFSTDEQITIGNDSLAFVVNELQPFKFLADDGTEEVYDVIGTAFEVYVASHLKGNRGQYFTNRLVVNMMIDMLDPSERDVIFDPASGSGGFLIAALRHVRQKIAVSGRSPSAKIRETQQVKGRILGIDIAPKLVRVAKTNMILNGDGHGGLVQGNSLRGLTELPANFPLHPESKSSQRPTLILTNPPFGASRELRVREKDVLDQFDLGHVWSSTDNRWLRQENAVNDGEGVPLEILFLERCIKLLEPGGRLAIVIARGLLDNRDALPARQYLLRYTRLLGVINCHPNTFAPFNGTKAAILIVEKKRVAGFQSDEEYPVFMAVSQKVGQDSQGHEVFKKNTDGDWVVTNGQRVLDHDMSEIAQAWRDIRTGKASSYDAAWTVPLSRLMNSQDMRMNPVRYAPEAEQALARVLELADSPEWRVERLGDIANSNIFNGPRFKRPFAADGVTAGASIVRMYTPKSFFEERGESAKYLDLSIASPAQLRQIEVLKLRPNFIMIVDSGTAGRSKLVGRVGMTSAAHDGAVGNNNMIRVIIDDPILRSYVYHFLRTELGQTLVFRNVYGTNQDHIEPDDIKDIPVPIPRDEERLKSIASQVQEAMKLREQAAEIDKRSTDEFRTLLGQAFANSDLDAPIAVREPDETE